MNFELLFEMNFIFLFHLIVNWLVGWLRVKVNYFTPLALLISIWNVKDLIK